MKKHLSYHFAVIACYMVMCSCTHKDPVMPEFKRALVVQKHLRQHYPEDEFNRSELSEDSLDSYYVAYSYKVLNEHNHHDAIIITPNHYNYYYINKKGEKVQGYAYIIEDNKLMRGGADYSRVIILSKDNKVVYCGTEYPSSYLGPEHIGECTNDIIYNYMAGFNIDEYNDYTKDDQDDQDD